MIFLLMTLHFTELLPIMTIIQHSNRMSTINFCLSAKHLALLKSKKVFFSWKRIHSIPPPCLTLGHSPLAQVSNYKYLGLLITTDLMWSTHIANICTKTRKLIGILYRRFHKYSSCTTLLKLYITFIRPHVEYAAAAWDPFLIGRTLTS